MKKNFANPFCEVVRFGTGNVVCTSGDCCDVAGTVFDDDDEVCPGGDSHCSCDPDASVNCKT